LEAPIKFESTNIFLSLENFYAGYLNRK